jgi:quercetin dioxygenase-like cupin family protein
VEIMNTAADLGAGYSAPACTASGVAYSARFVPAGFSLWLVVARIEAGATVRWQESHGDEGIYIIDGAVSVEKETCTRGGAVIVESGVPAVMRADVTTELVHVGPVAEACPTGGLLGPADTQGHRLHVVEAEKAENIDFGVLANTIFADSTCGTCRINFFRVDGPDQPYVVGSHLHSEDEIIHVLSGALQVGPRTVSAGMSIAIPGGQRYGFRTTGGYSFLNYRADASTVVTAPGSEPRLETVESLRQTLGSTA